MKQRHYKTTAENLDTTTIKISFNDESTISSPGAEPAAPSASSSSASAYLSRPQPPRHEQEPPRPLAYPSGGSDAQVSVSTSKDRISITRAVYDLLIQREKMYEDAVQKKMDMRYEMEAATLDIERATVRCRLAAAELHLVAARPADAAAADLSLGEAHVTAMQQQMQALAAQRDRIVVNRKSSELLTTHALKLQRFEAAAGTMADALHAARTTLEDALSERAATVRNLERAVADRQQQLDDAHTDIARLHEAQRAASHEKIRLTEELAAVRSQVALVEAHASESLNLSSTQAERERQAVARLEATLEHTREEVKRGAVELEQWKAQARLDAMQRAELRATNDELEGERNALKEALEAVRQDREGLARRLEKATFEADVQIKALSEQLRDATAGDDTQRATISQQTDEIRTLKTDLRQALETIERTKVDMERSKSSVSTELAELRERVSYLRTHLEAEEGKARAQRDEMEDAKRAHRSELGDMEDEVRRLKSQLADAHAREARLAPTQQRADDLAQQVMALSQEAKALTLENGRLEAEMTRLTHRRAAEDSESNVAHRSSGNTLARAQETIKQLEVDLAAARAEAAQARLDCEKMKLEMGLKAKEVESALAHTQALETRKEFLARSVKELEDLVARLSGQVQRERALGTSTEQRIAEMRSLVPYWRWEAKDRAERTTLGASFSSNAHAPSLSTSGIYGSSYLGSSGLR